MSLIFLNFNYIKNYQYIPYLKNINAVITLKIINSTKHVFLSRDCQCKTPGNIFYFSFLDFNFLKMIAPVYSDTGTVLLYKLCLELSFQILNMAVLSWPLKM